MMVDSKEDCGEALHSMPSGILYSGLGVWRCGDGQHSRLYYSIWWIWGGLNFSWRFSILMSRVKGFLLISLSSSLSSLWSPCRPRCRRCDLLVVLVLIVSFLYACWQSLFVFYISLQMQLPSFWQRNNLRKSCSQQGCRPSLWSLLALYPRGISLQERLLGFVVQLEGFPRGLSRLRGVCWSFMSLKVFSSPNIIWLSLINSPSFLMFFFNHKRRI